MRVSSGRFEQADSVQSQTWLLKFHPEKCKVMHIGHQINTGYKMMDAGKTVQLKTTTEEKDLGV